MSLNEKVLFDYGLELIQRKKHKRALVGPDKGVGREVFLLKCVDIQKFKNKIGIKEDARYPDIIFLDYKILIEEKKDNKSKATVIGIYSYDENKELKEKMKEKIKTDLGKYGLNKKRLEMEELFKPGTIKIRVEGVAQEYLGKYVKFRMREHYYLEELKSNIFKS